MSIIKYIPLNGKIYLITNLVNNKKYVGQTKKEGKDFEEYWGSGVLIQKAIEKYGIENFTKEILKDNIKCKSALDLHEIIYIKKYNTLYNQHGYNISMGGGGTYGVTMVKDKDNNRFWSELDNPKYLSGEWVNIQKDIIQVRTETGDIICIPNDDTRIISGELESFRKNSVVVMTKEDKIITVLRTDPKFLSNEFSEVINVKFPNGNIEWIKKTDPRYLSGELKHYNSEMVAVHDDNGNSFQVHHKDPRFISGELKTFSFGKTAVKDLNNNVYFISVDDERIKSGELVNINKNTVHVQDSQGNKFTISTFDPRYISGELKSIHYNSFYAKDIHGNTFIAKCNDPRRITGEIFGNTTGKFVAKDIEGNTLWVDCNDPRRKTGEIVGNTKGKINVINPKTGECFNINNTDERWLKKELISISVGKIVSNETKEKQRNAKLGKYIGENNPNYGKYYIFDIELKIHKSFTKEEFETYISNKNIKDSEICSIHNGDKRTIQIKVNELNKWILSGWKIGCNKNYIYVNNKKLIENRKIRIENIQDFLNSGWCIGYNSNFMCIHNKITNENKQIEKNNWEIYKKLGWCKGNITGKKFGINSPNYNRIWIYNSNFNQSKMIDPINFPNFEKDGWAIGVLPKNKDTFIKKICIYNPINNKCIKILPNKLEEYKLSGWQLGRLTTQNLKNTVWINNSTSQKQISKNKLDEFLNSGWTKGRLPNKNKSAKIGKSYIHHLTLKQNKIIFMDQFPTFESQGWVRGRKMKFDANVPDTTNTNDSTNATNIDSISDVSNQLITIMNKPVNTNPKIDPDSLIDSNTFNIFFE